MASEWLYEAGISEARAALVEDGTRVLSDVVASQHDVHRPYGGVVPELASRAHVVNVVPVLREALETVQAKCVATDYTWGDAYTLLDGRHPKDVDEVVGILNKAQAELAKLADATPDRVDPRAGAGIGAE